MAVDFKKARDFVYSNGNLWERALFAYLFQDGAVERVQQCLKCYKNPDGGFGHALEHDIRYPGSHPLALEYLLGVLRGNGVSAGDLLDDTAAWMEANQQADGFLIQKPELLDYPHAPWWKDGGQNLPDSIVAGLMYFDKANDAIITKTRTWVQENLTLEAIKQEEWLFMMYHAHDYFHADDDFPDVKMYREATQKRIIELGQQSNDKQLMAIFNFAPTPQSPIAKAAPDLIEKALNILDSSQQEDGHWADEHDLPQWSTASTTGALLTLRRYGRWT